MDKSVKSGIAMLDVLESWGVDHLYGIPGGSINSTLEALFERRESLRYIQVRHEETGALAAAVDAKLTGRLGVCFGSAGPGATHLYNGLYDAMMDKVPVLALIGQVASTRMNSNTFQEQNEDPLFADVAVYNRTIMSPESLPFVVDEAVRQAYKKNGPAVVTLPVDFGYEDIPDLPYSSAGNRRRDLPSPDVKDIETAAMLIAQAKRPVVYVGQGARGYGDEVLAMSMYFSMPIVMSVLAKGIIPDSSEAFMGMGARVATKPANEALAACDLIVFIGSDFPFARDFFPPEAKFIQIDVDPLKLGRRHRTDVAILGDASESMRLLRTAGMVRAPDAFFNACLENRRNWCRWLEAQADKTDSPLRPEPVFRHINRIATDDAIFVTDVGNVTVHAIRLLDMNGRGHRFTTSGLFATMGYGVPGGIAAKLSYPERQVFTLSGDGGFAMAMHDILTQVKYKLPIINVVLSNQSLGFIEAEQEDTKQPLYGVDLVDADYAKIGEAMGARGFSVTSADQLAPAFDAARESDRPVVIDVKIRNTRPIPVEQLVLDPEKHDAKDIAAFKTRYEVEGMPTLRELLK